eukprot:1137144-Amphidinium_carterae.1
MGFLYTHLAAMVAVMHFSGLFKNISVHTTPKKNASAAVASLLRKHDSCILHCSNSHAPAASQHLMYGYNAAKAWPPRTNNRPLRTAMLTI